MTEKDPVAVAGARFERIDGDVMFSFVNDPLTVVGPRRVTAADKANYPAEWGHFLETEAAAFNGADPAKFDHDGDGAGGGGPPGGIPPKKRGRPPRAKT